MTSLLGTLKKLVFDTPDTPEYQMHYDAYLTDKYKPADPNDPLNKLFGSIYTQATLFHKDIDYSDFGKQFFEQYRSKVVDQTERDVHLGAYHFTNDQSFQIMMTATTFAADDTLRGIIAEAGHHTPSMCGEYIAGSIAAPTPPLAPPKPKSKHVKADTMPVQAALALEPAAAEPTTTHVTTQVSKTGISKKYFSDSSIARYAGQFDKSFKQKFSTKSNATNVHSALFAISNRVKNGTAPVHLTPLEDTIKNFRTSVRKTTTSEEGFEEFANRVNAAVETSEDIKDYLKIAVS